MLWTTIKLGKSCIKLLKGYHMIAPPRPSMIAAHVPVSAAPPGAAPAKVPKTGPACVALAARSGAAPRARSVAALVRAHS